MEKFMTGKVLITGANGYIGRHLAVLLMENMHNVLLTDIQEASYDGHLDYTRSDIRNCGSFADMLNDVSLVFHLAGMTGTWDSFERYRDFIEVNEIGLLNLLDAVSKTENRAKVVFPSTRLVYKGLTDGLLKEESPLEFKTIYAANKFACENYLKMYHEIYGVNYTVFRICVPYGNLLDEKLSYGTINHFVKQAEKGEHISIFGDGSQKRTFIHIDDLTHVLMKGGFSSRTDNGVFNIGGNNVLSIKDVASKIAQKYGVKVRFVPWPKTAQLLESGDTAFDSGRVDAVTGHAMKHDFFAWLDGL